MANEPGEPADGAVEPAGGRRWPAGPPPVLPDYGGACLDSLVPALLRHPEDRPAWLPDEARAARQVVLLVLDGLGWDQLVERPALAPNLAAMAGGPITSVVPTTTATALASIALGRPPAAHGVVGYRVRVDGPTGAEILNVLRWRTASGDARSFVPPAEFQPQPAFAGQAVPALTRIEFLDSGFTSAHLRGSRLVWWATTSAMGVDTRRLLAEGHPLVYAYYDGVDKVAHIYGFGEYYDAELKAADRLVGDLAATLPPGAALVVTADHGQVQVGASLIDLAPELLAQTSLVSGEARFCWLHARPDRREAVLNEARDRYRDQAWIATCEELEAWGWFGGPLSPAGRTRLGDVAIVPHQPVGLVDPKDRGEVRLVCRHGSLTSAEMVVPLVAVAP